MYLSDAEIRAILIKEKKRKRRRKRIIRRITALVVLILALILAIGLIANRDAFHSPFVGRGVIFLDVGHGGGDPGSQAMKHVEKDDTLKLTLAVKKELEDLGFKVYLSRDDDSDIDRAARGEMANEKNAKLMISFHRNKSPNGDGEGVEVWIPSSNSKECQTLGQNILDALVAQGFYGRGVHPGTLTDPNEDYYENSTPTMPSCIAEVGFVNWKKDNQLFDDNLEENAKALAKAIEASFVAIYGE